MQEVGEKEETANNYESDDDTPSTSKTKRKRKTDPANELVIPKKHKQAKKEEKVVTWYDNLWTWSLHLLLM